jgi:ABC-type transport system involved in multi-copper enzyme maturation permease subunit
MIWSIICKDILQHRRSLLIFAAVGLMLSLPGKAVVLNYDLSPTIHRFLFTYITVLTPMELTMWFVGQEKVKETIRVLRLLPITPAQFVTAKMLGIVLLSEAFFFGSTLTDRRAVCAAWTQLQRAARPRQLRYQPQHAGIGKLSPVAYAGAVC